MAIIYSYPRASVQLVDYLIGTKKDESGNPTKSFLVSDLVDLINQNNTLQAVTDNGNSTDNILIINDGAGNVTSVKQGAIDIVYDNGLTAIACNVTPGEINFATDLSQAAGSLSSSGVKLTNTSGRRVNINPGTAITADRSYTFPNASGVIALQSAASGSFTSVDGKTITVVNGIITSIV